ncbi:MAG: flagellar basal body rod modification protein [Rhodobacterales bacterium]|nr:MAG: flagellar basal body rod modification protein [Rhodobacterales bacterium]
MQVSQATPAPQPSAPVKQTDQSLISSDFDTFLKMMTAQVQNQDPMNPMDSTEFSTQLATFSGVEQQVKTNDLLTALGTQMGIMGMAQLASWIGLEARASAQAHFDGTPVSISPNPASGADRAVLVVRDADGNEVQRQEFVPSTDEIQWAGVDGNGQAFASGLYSFEVESYSGDDLLATTGAEVYSEVVEAKSLNGATILVLRGGVQIDASNVTGLRGQP